MKPKLSKIKRRHHRIRSKLSGTLARPRVSVFRSALHLYIQIIDDGQAKTLVSMSDEKAKGKTKVERATILGEALAKKAKSAGISKVVFDRGGYRYHGRVKALADGLRSGGLEF